MKIITTYTTTDIYHIDIENRTLLERLEYRPTAPTTLKAAIRTAKKYMRQAAFAETDHMTAVIFSGTTGEVMTELASI